MINYSELTKEERNEKSLYFSEWKDWFIEHNGFSRKEEVYINERGDVYTLSDYFKAIEKVFAYQAPIRIQIGMASSIGGKDMIRSVIYNTAPLVLEKTA